MRTTEVDLQELAAIPAFNGCSRAELAAIDARGTELRVRAGRALCHQGGRARELVILLEGYATVSRSGQLAGQVGPGTVLGGVEIANGVEHTTTVIAKSVTRVLVIAAQDYAELRLQVPDVASRLAGLVPASVRTGRARSVERRELVPAGLLRLA